MSQDNSKIPNSNDRDELTTSILVDIQDNIRQVIRDKLIQYFPSDNALFVSEGSEISDLFEAIFNEVWQSTISSIVSAKDKIDENNLQNYYNIINNSLQGYKESQQSSLFKTQPFEAIPTAALMLSSINSQIKKQESWQKNEEGIAVAQHRAKGNPQNYIEHYISTPGDVTLLPWNEAQQIIDKFGFNSVKLHLILAAYTMEQEKPWESLFTVKGSELIEKIGWDKRTDLPKHKKLLEIAKTAFALDCLLVKTVWIEGRNRKGGINASTPVGRMWNITIVPSGQVNTSGKIEEPDEVQIIVQPGAWTKYFLNRAGAESREALYQFGYLAQKVLEIDPYHEELTLRLAIYLTLDSRVRLDGNYRVQELIEIALPKTEMDKALGDRSKAFSLKQRWDNALKHLLNKLNWQIVFDPETYPEWLRPEYTQKQPKGYFKKLLDAKLTIKPPHPIPELIASKVKPKVQRLQPKTKDTTPEDIKLTGSQVREARIAKGWSQTKLAGVLTVSQNFISLVERGSRPLSLQQAALVRMFLDIKI
ncbi:putative transcription factor, MBF1 like protein (plasmid) [Cylindrospermum stagnale PCC 7417]|uniref:Putative transcription factor, MBF1 like protein n=1 Tax=Cylindrospermum stagnale PCC 7417 TaxID=56107 RepID=K9X6X8_9NOST|nr:helix-turn-helix domain-containing protein [Cylindrospermum stagnale]AFZ28385.1 putative transcription factor, MBF1 like protein [Cylindrospermum stagnale PCC 7417]